MPVEIIILSYLVSQQLKRQLEAVVRMLVIVHVWVQLLALLAISNNLKFTLCACKHIYSWHD